MNRVAGSAFWKIAQQYSVYAVRVVVQIILARLLLPKDFGVVAEMLVFVSVATMFADSGLGTALVQKKNADELDFSSVAVGGFLFALLLYVLIFAFAPAISRFYKEPQLALLLRVVGVVIFFNTFNSVQMSYLYRTYNMKPLFLSTMVAGVISGAIAVFMAYSGFGVWSLVAQTLIQAIIAVVLLQLLIEWRLKIAFNVMRFKELFSFSWKVLVSSILINLFENIYNMTIGKYYSSTILGYYSRGNMFPSMLVGQVYGAINSVTLPLLSQEQDNNEKLVALMRKVVRISVIIQIPLAFGLAAVATPLVRLLLTEKWLPCVFFLRLESVFFAALSIMGALYNGIIAQGSCKRNIEIEAIKLCLVILCVLTLHGYGVKLLCVARTIIGVAMVFYTSVITSNLFGYKLRLLFADILAPLALSLFMGVAVYCVEFLGLCDIVTLVLQVVLGATIYLAGMLLFMKQDVDMILKMVLKK